MAGHGKEEPVTGRSLRTGEQAVRCDFLTLGRRDGPAVIRGGRGRAAGRRRARRLLRAGREEAGGLPGTGGDSRIGPVAHARVFGARVVGRGFLRKPTAVLLCFGVGWKFELLRLCPFCNTCSMHRRGKGLAAARQPVGQASSKPTSLLATHGSTNGTNRRTQGHAAGAAVGCAPPGPATRAIRPGPGDHDRHHVPARHRRGRVRPHGGAGRRRLRKEIVGRQS